MTLLKVNKRQNSIIEDIVIEKDGVTTHLGTKDEFFEKYNIHPAIWKSEIGRGDMRKQYMQQRMAKFALKYIQ